jgi:hypothetical protein
VDVDRRGEAAGRLVGGDQGGVVGGHAVGRRGVVAAGGAELEGRMAADDLAEPAHHAGAQQLLQPIRVHVRRVGMQGIGVGLGQEGHNPGGEAVTRVGGQRPWLAEDERGLHAGAVIQGDQVVAAGAGVPPQVGVGVDERPVVDAVGPRRAPRQRQQARGQQRAQRAAAADRTVQAHGWLPTRRLAYA